MTIEVTGCHDCPFAECDYHGGLKYWCEHFGNGGKVFDVDYCVEHGLIHESCPLKQETIKIKLKSDETNN